VFKLIERISEFLGHLAAWMFFTVGAMITYEVIARYVFLAPTTWAEEISEFFQIWATYLAAAYVLKHNDLIRITFLLDRAKPGIRRLLESISLLAVAVFCLVAIWYGMEILLESIEQNRHTATILGVPKWATESAIPLGALMLLMQAVVHFVRLFDGTGQNQPAATPSV
jgi:C4-dicarboxylate transporter DctQ subunit